MPVSRWIIAVAFGLIATLGAAQDQAATENQPRQNESTPDTQTNRDDQQAQPFDFTPALNGIERAIRDLEAEVDKVEQDRQREADRRDLEAQEGMAWWAELMFYATAATVVLTALALFAIIRTLHHTRRAADYTEGMLSEAKKTTVAAQRATDVAVSGDRPWVIFERYEWGISQNGSFNGVPHDLGWVFQLRWKNFGRSPAVKTLMISSYSFVKKGDEINISPPEEKEKVEAKNVITSFLAPNAEAVAGTVILSDQDVSDISAGTHTLFMFGSAHYSGTMGGEFITKIGISINCTGMEKGKGDSFYPRFEVTAVKDYDVLT